jgi:hypothetical protein
LPVRQVSKPTAIAADVDPITVFVERSGIVSARSFYPKIPSLHPDPCSVRWSGVDCFPFAHFTFSAEPPIRLTIHLPDCAVIQFTSHAHVSSRLVSHFLEQLLYLAVVWGRHRGACPVGVNLGILSVSRALPLYPGQRTSQARDLRSEKAE